MIFALKEAPYHDPYWEVEGLHESGVWHPLYQYHDGAMARAIMGKILEQDPPECKEYEDFRVVAPDERPLTARQTAALARKTAQEPRSPSGLAIDPARVVRTPLRAQETELVVCYECGETLSKIRAEEVDGFYRHKNCAPETQKRGKRQKAVRA